MEPTAKNTATDRNRSSTFAKGLAVLTCFSAQSPALGISDVARLCGLDRAVARRLLLTLVDLGYLTQQAGKFSMTPRVMGIAGAFLQSRNYGTLVQPILEACARDLGTTVSLAVADAGTALYVAQANATPTRVTFGFTVGSRLPMYCTAIGHMLLAGLPDAEIQTALQEVDRVAHTATTRTDIADLTGAVKAVRKSNRALVSGAYEAGVTGLAVPVGSTSEMPFALGTSILDSDQTDTRRAEVFDGLEQCARILGRLDLS